MHLCSFVARCLVACALLPVGTAHADPGAIVGEVAITERGLLGVHAKKDRSGVVVYLEGLPAPSGGAPLKNAQLRQREQRFVPRVIAIQKGASVDFPNEDKIFHNVFSLSQGAKFDLGLYKSGTSKTVAFERPGTVDVYCNIHPEMVATIKVLDTPFFAVSDDKGRFRIAGVPAGTYPIVGWQAHGAPWRGTVTVAAGHTAEVKLELREGDEPARHLRKDGTPYGRYQ
jgi:plastocyanin